MNNPRSKGTPATRNFRSLLWIVPTAALIILSSCHKPEAPKPVAPPPPPVVEAPAPLVLQKFVGLPPVPKKNCAKPKEFEALNTRALQTELTLVALSCGQHKEYQQFVERYQGDLAIQAKVLREYFLRHYKKQSDYRLDQFVTRLANAYSQQIQVNKGNNAFCREGRDIFKAMEVQPAPPLTYFTSREPLTTVHGVSECK